MCLRSFRFALRLVVVGDHHQFRLGLEVHPPQQAFEVDQRRPARIAHDETAPQFERLRRFAEHLPGGGQDLCLGLARGTARSVAGDEGGAGGMYANVPRGNVGIVVDDGHVFQRHAQFLGDDQGDHRVDALADFGGAGDDGDAGVVVHLENGADAIRLMNLGAAGVVDGRGEADAFLVAAGLVPLRRVVLALSAVVAGPGGGFQALRERALAQEGLLRRVFAGLLRVLEMELEWVDVHHVGQHVHLLCGGVSGLDVAVSAERTGVRVVRVDRLCLEVDHRHAIVARGGAHHDDRNGRPP